MSAETVEILVTGGAGFIGSNVVNLLTQTQKVVVIDRMGYMSRKSNWEQPENVIHVEIDINDKLGVLRTLHRYQIKYILHFAAQTHVCNSFDNEELFIRDNIKGTNSLLKVCREYGQIVKFIHVSTDEVYGEVPFDQETGCKESDALHPTNPYAATKAGAEYIATSYMKSYGIPIIITRGNNVYGKYQYPEKVIPKFAVQLLTNKPLTIHGAGTAKRHFCYAEDVARAFLLVLEKGVPGQIYNIGTETDEYSVIEVGEKLSNLIRPDMVTDKVTVPDRKFNDCRYHIDCSKMKELGWVATTTFDEGLKLTVDFYDEHLAEYASCI